MSLFPQLSENYYVDNDRDILKLMDYTYSKNITINQSYWSEADIDARFHAGDQTVYNDIYGNVPAFRKRQFSFNRIRRIVNMISGYQRQHRKSIVATPVEGSDEQTANQFSKLFMHTNTHGKVLETFSDAFEGAMVSGMNLLSVWMDYRSDPVNGDIKVDNCAYNSYLIDPYFKKKDLSDCNSIWTRKYLSKFQVESLIPGRSDEIKNLAGWGNRDGKFQFIPESYNYAMQDLLIYDEFWYLDTRKQKNIVDIESGECIEWRGQDEDLQYFLKMHPQTTIVENIIPTVKLAVVVQGKVMYHGANPLGIDRYPFVPVWAYYAPHIPYFPWRVQGVVRGIRDSNYLYTRQKTIQLDILESQITSGWKYKENALVNPKDVFLSGQGRGLALKAEAQMTDVEQIPPPQIPPSMIQISELLAKEIQEISGVSEELLGMADDDKAGVLSMLRQGANLVTLQGLFDNADQSLKLLGQIEMEIMQANWTPGKVRRIINEEPSQQFYNRAFGKYDCVVEEGLYTSTQRQMQFAQLIHLRELGLPVTSKQLVEASTLQNKQQYVEELQQAEQQQAQMAQEQSMVQMEVLKAQIEDLKAKATANQGLGLERASRINENESLAVERRAQAVYDEVRAVKELQNMDLQQLQQLVDILERLKSTQDQQNDELNPTNMQQTASM